MGALAPETAFLYATERRDLGGDQAGVDADHAGLQRFGHAPDPAAIARIEIGSQAERRVVAHRDHVGLVLETKYRCEGSKGLLVRHQGIRTDIREHSRLEERAAERMALSAGDDLGA